MATKPAKKYAGYREGKESMKEERMESRGLQRHEKGKGMERKMARKGCK